MSTAILSILIGIVGMFGYGLYDHLGGVYAKQIGPFKSIFWSQPAGSIFVLLLLFAFTINMDIPILVIFLLPVASIVYSAGYLFFSKVSTFTRRKRNRPRRFFWVSFGTSARLSLRKLGGC
jgi:hypothetical protein